MKHIRRPAVSLPTLRKGGKGWDETDTRATQFEVGQNVTEVNTGFTPYWGNADVRGALWAMHGRSCTYCDRELHGNDRGDVEHFRPKNVYWWLAYQFQNYLLACSVCNSSYKSNRFPILPLGAAFAYPMKDQLEQEPRALLDPAVDAIDGWFGINFDLEQEKREGFQITINSTLGSPEAQRCVITRDFFRLNLDSELLKARQIAIHSALKLANRALDGDQVTLNELRQRAIRYCPHSFAVRQVIVLHAKRPQYLPTHEEEVAWLVDELLSMLRFALNALDERAAASKESDMRDRCAWALAVLMKDPPALGTVAIRDRLQSENVLAMVQPLYDAIK